MVLQWAGLAVCAAIVLLVFGWVISQRKESPALPALAACCVLGIVLVWIELVRAPRDTGAYILTQLPFRPIGAFGLAGAQVFACYLLFKLPDGRLPHWAAFLLKAGYCLCAWFLQSAIWEFLSR